jgi:hypothetical protein
MDMPTDRVPETMTSAFDIIPRETDAPMSASEQSDLCRAINERRAQMENPELLRRLRSL